MQPKCACISLQYCLATDTLDLQPVSITDLELRFRISC
jgi:hypothetical protein